MESWRVRPRCCLSHDHPYAPVAAGLELVLGRTEGEHLALRFVEAGFVDRHVEVELLGTVRVGPLRRLVVRRPLEAQQHRVAVTEAHPVLVGVGDVTTDELPVELSQHTGRRTVQDDGSHLCDSRHAPHVASGLMTARPSSASRSAIDHPERSTSRRCLAE